MLKYGKYCHSLERKPGDLCLGPGPHAHGEKIAQIPIKCPLTSIHMSWHIPYHTK